MKRVELFLFLLVIPFLSWIPCIAQRSNIWCFGHEAGINFNSAGPATAISSHIVSRGSCASISNLSGQLLFTAAPDTDWIATGYMFNMEINRPNGSIMPGGDSLVGAAWYYETTIIPFPHDTNKYYVFSIGVTTTDGLYFHVVDMSLDNGQGEVIQKNTQLLNFRMVDCLLAVKHGNGRDWWIIARKSPVAFPNSNNTWYVYLVNPNGVYLIGFQNVGTLNGTNAGRLSYDTLTDRICFVNGASLVELYDFDRCNGLLSNSITIEPPQQAQPFPYYWTSEFSPSGQYLYVGGYIANDSSYLWQYDTWSANITASKTLIWQSNYPVSYVIGQLKRAPDGKIYLSNGWVDTTGNYQFPYLSNQYYPENMNLSVINSPDLPGAACDFQPYSFYLGGKRTYWGLPNNPDYELGPLIGSGCDTLTALPPTTHNPPPTILSATWSPNWQKAFINATNLKGHKWRLEVFDLFGNIICRDNGSLTPPYFSRGIELPGLASGMYVVRFQTEKELLTGKFVAEK